MGSLFAHLFDTLPFVAATCNAARPSRQPWNLRSRDLRCYLAPAAKGAIVKQDLPGKPSTPWNQIKGDELLSVPLWRWTNVGNEIHDVGCRVREQGYRALQVLDRVAWGVYNGDELEKAVRVTPKNGKSIELLLNDDFLHSKWYVHNAFMAKGSHRYWPLEACLDSAVVMAYAYVLDEGKPRPYRPAASDPSEQALVEFSDSRKDAPDWLERALSGDFLPGGPDIMKNEVATESATVAAVGETRHVSAKSPHILVVLSFSVHKERADWEPGLVVGAARLYPHVMVKANIDLDSVEAAVLLARPRAVTPIDPTDGAQVGTCCDALPPIGALLITDSSRNWDIEEHVNKVYYPMLALWDHVFDYAQPDAATYFKGWIPMVRKNLGPRPLRCGNMDITKVEGQAYFDNVHLSPRLKLEPSAISWWYYPMGPLFPGRFHKQPLTPADWPGLYLDRVVMAPFCSNDCFHMHVRWSSLPSTEQVYGWDDTGPYKRKGAMMVPKNQDVDIRFEGPAAFAYRAVAAPAPANHWQIIMHHGASHGQGLNEAKALMTANFGQFVHGEPEVHFHDENGKPLDNMQSMPVFYWQMRYRFEYVDPSDPTKGVKAFKRLGAADDDPEVKKAAEG